MPSCRLQSHWCPCYWALQYQFWIVYWGVCFLVILARKMWLEVWSEAEYFISVIWCCAKGESNLSLSVSKIKSGLSEYISHCPWPYLHKLIESLGFQLSKIFDDAVVQMLFTEGCITSILSLQSMKKNLWAFSSTLFVVQLANHATSASMVMEPGSLMQ